MVLKKVQNVLSASDRKDICSILHGDVAQMAAAAKKQINFFLLERPQTKKRLQDGHLHFVFSFQSKNQPPLTRQLEENQESPKTIRN